MKKALILFSFLILMGGKITLRAQAPLGKAEKSFAKLTIRTGTKTITLANDLGKKWNAKITFPEGMESSDSFSLLIALHWAGDFGTYKEFNDCLIVPALTNLNTVILTPEGERQQWSTDNNVDKILSIVRYAPKYWNVDPNKIAITGYSNGGNGSWYFAENHSEYFSAAIPMASSYPVNKKISVPLYVIHGEKDELFPVGKTTNWVNQTKNSGSDVTLIVNERLSHFQGCSYLDELKKAGRWLNELWTKK